MKTYTDLDGHSAPVIEPIAELSGVHIRSGAHALLTDITLHVNPEEHLALIGPNGAGKSILMKLLSGDIRPSTPEPGEAAPVHRLFGEHDFSLQSLRQRIGLVSPSLEQEFLMLAPNISGRNVVLSGVGGRFSEPAAGEISDAHIKRLARLQDNFGVSDALLRRPWIEFSTGERRICFIMRSLMRAPRLLLLDEPACGLDLRARDRLFETLASAAGKCAVMIISHAPEDMYAHISRVVLLARGKIIADGPKHKVMTEADFSCIYGVSVGLYRSGEGYQLLR